MKIETKKRLLLSKWRAQRAQIDNLKADLDEAREKIESLEEDANGRHDDIIAVLETVKYWLHDGIVHGKLVSDPRRLLRKVEEVLQ